MSKNQILFVEFFLIPEKIVKWQNIMSNSSFFFLTSYHEIRPYFKRLCKMKTRHCLAILECSVIMFCCIYCINNVFIHFKINWFLLTILAPINLWFAHYCVK